jgi:hypothetical protein
LKSLALAERSANYPRAILIVQAAIVYKKALAKTISIRIYFSSGKRAIQSPQTISLLEPGEIFDINFNVRLNIIGKFMAPTRRQSCSIDKNALFKLILQGTEKHET